MSRVDVLSNFPQATGRHKRPKWPLISWNPFSGTSWEPLCAFPAAGFFGGATFATAALPKQQGRAHECGALPCDQRKPSWNGRTLYPVWAVTHLQGFALLQRRNRRAMQFLTKVAFEDRPECNACSCRGPSTHASRRQTIPSRRCGRKA